jgi:hypothetical protein
MASSAMTSVRTGRPQVSVQARRLAGAVADHPKLIRKDQLEPDAMRTSPRIQPAATADPARTARRVVLRRRIRLVAATIAYNVLEAVVAISAGAVASSTALIGFGLDSVVEVASAAAVAWQFTAADPQRRE